MTTVLATGGQGFVSALAARSAIEAVKRDAGSAQPCDEIRDLAVAYSVEVSQ